MASNPLPRRTFVGLLTGLLLGLLAFLVAIPALGYFLGPLRRRAGAGPGAFRELGPLAEIPVGDWRLLSLELVRADGWKQSRMRHSVWVKRQGPGANEIVVLSSICPHLGCPINWIAGQSQFLCPCHGGVFDATGKHIAGPPPRNMDPLEFEVRADRLFVRWQDFKIGVEERVPVNV